MNYRRTSRCSYCYEKGHNRTTCPKMREEAAADPNSWAAIKLNRIKAKRKTTVRKCSYCGVPGHTKRTCTEKPIDAEKLNLANRVWRSKLVESLKEAGIGVGSLLRVKDTRASYTLREEDLLLVVDIKWDSMTVDTSSWSYREKDPTISFSLLNRVNNTNHDRQMICLHQRTGKKISVHIPQLYDSETIELFHYSSRNSIEIVCPSDPTPPNDWLICDDWAQKVM